MKRREFNRLTAGLFAGLMVPWSFGRVITPDDPIFMGEVYNGDTFHTVQDGDWHDPTTWYKGRIPADPMVCGRHCIYINHTVNCRRIPLRVRHPINPHTGKSCCTFNELFPRGDGWVTHGHFIGDYIA